MCPPPCALLPPRTPSPNSMTRMRHGRMAWLGLSLCTIGQQPRTSWPRLSRPYGGRGRAPVKERPVSWDACSYGGSGSVVLIGCVASRMLSAGKRHNVFPPALGDSRREPERSQLRRRYETAWMLSPSTSASALNGQSSGAKHLPRSRGRPASQEARCTKPCGMAYTRSGTSSRLIGPGAQKMLVDPGPCHARIRVCPARAESCPLMAHMPLLTRPS